MPKCSTPIARGRLPRWGSKRSPCVTCVRTDPTAIGQPSIFALGISFSIFCCVHSIEHGSNHEADEAGWHRAQLEILLVVF
eukprot:symbB.v1.2.031829.t1/scaffold3738.1/size51178/6